MTLSSRHSIRNSSPGGLRPSTLPLGHGGSPQYWLSHVNGEETFFCFFQAAEIFVSQKKIIWEHSETRNIHTFLYLLVFKFHYWALGNTYITYCVAISANFDDLGPVTSVHFGDLGPVTLHQISGPRSLRPLCAEVINVGRGHRNVGWGHLVRDGRGPRSPVPFRITFNQHINLEIPPKRPFCIFKSMFCQLKTAVNLLLFCSWICMRLLTRLIMTSCSIYWLSGFALWCGVAVGSILPDRSF